MRRAATSEEEREARLRTSLALNRDDQHWLDVFDPVLDELAEKIQLLEEDLEFKKQDCLSMELLDEDGQPSTFQRREQFYFRGDVNSEGQISDFLKHPLLLLLPDEKMTPEHVVGFEPKSNERSDITMSRINEWMLDRLCSSPLEVNLLARTFEGTVGKKTQDDWQLSVLKLWYEDGAGPAEGCTAYPVSSLSLDQTE